MPSLLTQLGTKVKDYFEAKRATKVINDVGDNNHTATADDAGTSITLDPSTQDRNFTINTNAADKGWHTTVKNLNSSNDVVFTGSATLRTPGKASPSTIKIVGSTDQYGTAYLEAIADNEIVIRGDITVT